MTEEKTILEEDGVIYNDDYTAVLNIKRRRPGEKGTPHINKNIIIRDGVKVISSGAFKDCRQIRSITFPSSLEEIEDFAFYGCGSLESVKFNGECKRIGHYAFSGCKSLKITFPKETKVESDVFNDDFHREDALVDLGLPSGTKWATSNLSNNYKRSFCHIGYKFPWGVIYPYPNFDSNKIDVREAEIDFYNENYKKIGLPNIKDISESVFDAAAFYTSGEMCIPTEEDFIELKNECSWELIKYGYHDYTEPRIIYLWKVGGKNGNVIFLTCGGYNDPELAHCAVYWTSTRATEENKAVVFIQGLDEDILYSVDANFGLPIRPVQHVSNDESFRESYRENLLKHFASKGKFPLSLRLNGNNLFFNLIFVEGEGAIKDFFIMDAPITLGMDKALGLTTPKCLPTKDWEYSAHPASYRYDDIADLSWGVERLLNKINELTGFNFRLPTEKEWEYAAKGGKSSHGYKFSGSDDIDKVGWCKENLHVNDKCGFDSRDIRFVKQKEPNELGIYDMSGLVPELCADGFKSSERDENHNLCSAPEIINPIRKGGSCKDPAEYAEISNQFKVIDAGGLYSLRLVLPIE